MKVMQAVPGSERCQARIDELQETIQDYVRDPRTTQSPEEVETLEREIRALTDESAALVSGRQIQHALDSQEIQEQQSKLVTAWPHRLEQHERVGVRVRTASGDEVRVKAKYFRRKGKRWGKKRYQGFYLGLLLLGINERCTPGFAAEVSLLVAMPGSLAEARAVLAERGIRVDLKVLRNIAYRFSQRARLTRQLQGMGFDETVAGRRAVVGMDGGRIRIREKKPGRKTAKGRSRYQGAWREPKLFTL